MKFYLSSYGLGERVDELQKMMQGRNKKVAFIPNAADFIGDEMKRNGSNKHKIEMLVKVGFEPVMVNLKEYTGKTSELKEVLDLFDLIRVRGGNVYSLWKAMRSSGCNKILHEYIDEGVNKIYAGYSAGVCVLGPTLDGLHLVDQLPSDLQLPVVGVGVLPYCILPHYRSDHSESEAIEDVVLYYIEHKIPFKVLKDGEVLIV